jgi:hypothetical protein
VDGAREEQPDQAAVSPQLPAVSDPAASVSAGPLAARILMLQRSAGNRATVRLLARAPPPNPEKPPWYNAADRARTIMYQLHGGLGLAPDVEAALVELRGQPPEVLRDIRAHYAALPGAYNLERDLSELGTAAERREALTLLGRVLPLADHLRLSVHAGWFYDSVDEDVMVAALRERMRMATPQERAAAAWDGDAEAVLRSSLDASHLYSALVLLKGEATEAMVEERIRSADSWWWDDPQAVYDVLLDLPPARRRAFWERTRDGDLFAFLSWSERQAVERLCTADDEATALHTRALLATSGFGTTESGLEKMAERARQMREELAAVEARLALGASDDVDADTRSRTELSRALDKLRWAGGSDVVDIARGDLSAAEAIQFAADLGEDPYALFKQRLLEATKGDPEQVFAILQKAQAHPGWLWSIDRDNDVALALTTRLGMKEQELAIALRHGDMVGAARLRLRRALNAVNTDEGAIVAILLELSPADRARLRAADKPLCDDLIGHDGWFDRDLGKIVPLLLDPRTVEPPVDEVIKWAVGLAWDGTKAQALESALKLMPDARLAEYRLGYAAARGGVPAGFSEAETAAAAKTFAALENRLQTELAYGDYQHMLDVLLTPPTRGELETDRGIALAAAIVRLRAVERNAPREAAFTEAPSDWISKRVMDRISSTGPLADEALIRLEQGYAHASADASISESELAVLAALGQEYGAAHAAAVSVTDTVAWLASAAAAAAAAVAVTAASGGVLGPWIASVFAPMGLSGTALIGATAAGAAKVGTSELVAGSEYDATDEEGLRDFVGAFVDAGTTMIASSLITQFPKFIEVGGTGLGAATLSERLAHGTVTAAEASLRACGRSITLAAARGALESGFAGVVSEFAMRTVDERVWRQSVWDAMVTLGQLMLQSGLQGVGSGAGFGAAGEAWLAAVRGVPAHVMVGKLVAAGVPAERVQSLPLAAVRQIKQAKDALDAGEPAVAQALMESAKGIEKVDPAVIDEAWEALYPRPAVPEAIKAASPADEAALRAPPDEATVKAAPEALAGISPAADAKLPLPPPANSELLRWLPGWSAAQLEALRPEHLAALQRLHWRMAPIAGDPRVARGIARILPPAPARAARSPAGWARVLDPVPDNRLEAVLRMLGDPALPDPTLVSGSASSVRPVLRAGPGEVAFADRFGVGVWIELAGDLRWRDTMLPELIRTTSAMNDDDAREAVEAALQTVRASRR